MVKKDKKNGFLVKAAAAFLALAVTTTSVYFYNQKDSVNVEAATSRQVEYLDRGLIAMKTTDGVYVGWRYLGTDSSNIGFNIYRDGKKINSKVITDSTNYLDKSGSTSSKYYVKTVINGKETEQSDTVSVWGNQYTDIQLQKPASGTTPSGETYTYTPNDCSVADLDGDGEYEIIVKWDPSNSKDNSKKGYTGNVYLDAYKLDGTMLWRIDLGINIRAGAHYTQFMVYDFDGDGYAELICKTADGTKDGVGKYIGNKSKDYRNSNGYILSGPEYLTLFDGKTGAALDTIDYEPARGKVSSWGDSYGNRVDRFLATVAYLDGKTPSVVMCRGYYTRSVLVAYDVKNKKLSKRWTFDSNSSGNSAYKGQGFHNLATADVDGDGYDEIVYGACTIDHNGKGLYSTGLKHGDAVHVGDFDPTRDGLEVWGCFEETYGSALWDAKSGDIIFRVNASTDTGRCIAGNFIAGNNTYEMASYADSVLYNAKGKKVGNWSDITKWGMNYAIYWDADLEQEALDRTYVDDYSNGRLLTASGVTYNNSTKANTSLTADILGDWREEIIWPTTDGNALRIYSTTDVTSYRIYTLMHNTQYRCQVAAQNVGYNQGAYTDYYLGTGYDLPSQPNVYTAGNHSSSTTPDTDSSNGSSSSDSNSGSNSNNSSSSTVTAAKLDNGWYYIKNVNAQKYLQVTNNKGSDGANVEIGTGTGVAGQKWYLENQSDGYVTLKSATGYMLDLAYGNLENGANIGLWSANGLDPQLFKIVKSSTSNQYGIVTKVTGDTKGLDCEGFGKTDGTNVQQYSYGAQSNQLWIFEKTSYSSSSSSSSNSSSNTNSSNSSSSSSNTNSSNNSNSSSNTNNSNNSSNSVSVSMNGATLDLSSVSNKTITSVTFDLTAKSSGNGALHLKAKDGTWLGSADFTYNNATSVTVDLSSYSNLGNIDLYMWWNSNSASVTNVRVNVK